MTFPASTAEAASPGTRVAYEINKYRKANGKRPLRASRSLWRSSARYALRLIRGDQFRHGARIAAPRSFRRVGEALAYQPGWRLRVGMIVRKWMRSSVHRRVLLSRRFRWVGVGRARGRMAGGLATIWVVHVGRR